MVVVVPFAVRACVDSSGSGGGRGGSLLFSLDNCIRHTWRLKSNDYRQTLKALTGGCGRVTMPGSLISLAAEHRTRGRAAVSLGSIVWPCMSR